MECNDKLISTSKFLSLVLRHRPEVIGAKLDPEGWLCIDDLISQANAHGKTITLDLLHEVVVTNDKKRFALSNPKNFRSAVTSIIECGGDADTTAAIVGGIVGAGVGQAGTPGEWLDGIWEWPRSVSWMQRLGEALANSLDNDHSVTSPTVNPLAVLLRNLLFLFVVLFHGFRRLAPPY